MRIVLLGILILIGSITAIAADANKSEKIFRDISASEAAKLIKDKEVIILDIRTEEEYNSGYIKGALNIDYYKADFKERLQKLDKNKKYFIYCRSGRRSGNAMSLFQELGFKQVYNLKSGINQWINEKYELIRP